MRRGSIFFIILLFSVFQVSGFPVSVKTKVYGETYGYWTSYADAGEDFKTIYANKKNTLIKGRRMCPLKMDIYEPRGNYSEKRPLLVFIHGGAFFTGDKAIEPIVRICRHFASLGYVVASINYRLGFRPTPTSIVEAGFSAYLDTDAAIRYLLYYKDVYRIDPSKIFVGGSSAGAITALNIAFMREWDYPVSGAEHDRINPWMDDRYSIRAVANLWGAVMDVGMLVNANTPVISFHARWDPLVPLNYDYPFQELSLINGVLFDKMYGSMAIQAEAEALGRKAELYVYEVTRHDLYYDDEGNISSRLDEIIDRTASFFSEVMSDE